MLLLLFFLGVIVVGIIMLKISDSYYNDIFDFSAEMTILVGSAILVISLICIPLLRMDTTSDIQKFNAIQMTIDNARINNAKYETAAFQIKISEANQWLASTKYWNDSIFDIWIPDIIEDLQYIK